jgi:hypothetical protein
MTAQSWDQADIFALPLLDGGEGFGQVIAPEDGGALILLTLRTGARADVVAPIRGPDVVAILRTTATPLDDGTWPVVGLESLPFEQSALDPSRGPADPVDPAVVEAFLNACHGLLPWDYFPDKILFDTILAKGVERPAKARMGG